MANKKKIKDFPIYLQPYQQEEVLIKETSNTDWSHDFYKIKEIHEKGYTGKGVTVAVLDTGIQLDHFLFKKAREENRIEVFDATGGDGLDRQGHGSWCASRFIANDPQLIGFSPDVNLISIKVLGDSGSGSVSDIVKGYRIAIEQGADIISTSLGWRGRYAPFDAILQEAYDLGKILVSAAGNDGLLEDIDYPALYSQVFSIGSHNHRRVKSTFSDWGVDLDLYGSGESVKGAWYNNTISFANGTSMATPSVGALIALLLEKLKEEFGTIDRQLLKELATCQ